MSGLTRETRLQIMLTEQELAAIDDWRFQKRMPSRAAAIRRLIQTGLLQDGIKIADMGARSTDFGILRSKNGGGARSDGAGNDA